MEPKSLETKDISVSEVRTIVDSGEDKSNMELEDFTIFDLENKTIKTGRFRFDISTMASDRGLEVFAKALAYVLFVPIKIERLDIASGPTGGIYQYTGFSPLFDEVREGEPVPEYELFTTVDVGNVVEAGFERRDGVWP